MVEPVRTADRSYVTATHGNGIFVHTEADRESDVYAGRTTLLRGSLLLPVIP